MVVSWSRQGPSLGLVVEHLRIKSSGLSIRHGGRVSYRQVLSSSTFAEGWGFVWVMCIGEMGVHGWGPEGVRGNS